MSEVTVENVTAIEATLNGVVRALERLRLGTYRTCAEFSAGIDEVDLVGDALLAHCRDHRELR